MGETIEGLKLELENLKEAYAKLQAQKNYYVTDGSPFLCSSWDDDDDDNDDEDDGLHDKGTEQKNHVTSKWSVVNRPNKHTCGNIECCFIDNVATVADCGYYYMKMKEDKNLPIVPSYEQISSPLALYRTISLFKCGLSAEVVDFYKRNWFVTLKHNKTNDCLGLSEWMGEFKISTPFAYLDEMNAEYKEDVEELLTLLVRPRQQIQSSNK